MAISSKMRRCGESVHYLRSLKTQMEEVVNGEFEYTLTHEVGKRKLISHTDRIADEKLQTIQDLLERVLPQNIEVVRYNHHIEVSWRDVNKYAHCVTIADMVAVNPDWENDVTSDGEWVYPLDSYGSDSAWNGSLFPSTVKKLGIKEFPNIVANSNLFAKSSIEELDCNFPRLKYGNNLFRSNKLRVIKTVIGRTAVDASDRFRDCTALEEVYIDMSWEKHAVRTFENCKKLRVLDSDFSSLNHGGNMFEWCQIPKDIALRVLNTIPAYTSGSHPLTIGIHVDHQNDEEVLVAIANAEAKGWTLTVQWNGTPTSTTSTLSFGQLIYAKVGEHELPDGTTERVLDWGHYVTDETGYETFRSLESAYEYFGLPFSQEE